MIVERISEQEQQAVKDLLELHGTITQAMKGAKLSRRAIVNLRDFGRAEQTTVKKMRAYMRKKGVAVPA